MPEKPCSGWPTNGSDRPVGCGSPPIDSVRVWPAPVKRPETIRPGGASGGGGTMRLAGIQAWPASVAG